MLGGLAAAEAVEAVTGLAARLKWPNDVLVQGKKVAGVLAEAALEGERVEFVVLGIGINVNAGPGPGTHFPAASLAELRGWPIARASLLQALARRLGAGYALLEDDALQAAWAARLAWRGERVAAQAGAAVLEGVLEGVSSAGALVLRLDSGEAREVPAGEVRLRPAAGAAFPTPAGLLGGGRFRQAAFFGEPIEAGFDRQPGLQKKPGCPDFFKWRGETVRVSAVLAEWHDYRRRGRMARNMQPAHAAAAERRGSWGVGRDFYRVRTAAGRIFDLYYDRAPQGAGRGKGRWVLFSELVEDG
jgi:hypothetical protein